MKKRYNKIILVLRSFNLEAACQKALEQIEEKDYEEEFLDDDITTIRKYGIACRRRSCMARMGQ
ncbi:MAG: hypothetical protein HFI92_02895 [Lachnospiraceae bacterium]|nr:hypothetical protein [Lachnospiraceae bacterium]